MQKVAEWREITARANDVPRGRVVKDDLIYEVMSNPPRNENGLNALRSIRRGFDKNRYAAGLLEAIGAALAVENNELPKLPKTPSGP